MNNKNIQHQKINSPPNLDYETVGELFSEKVKNNPNKTARELSHDNFYTIIEQSSLNEMDKTILKYYESISLERVDAKWYEYHCFDTII